MTLSQEAQTAADELTASCETQFTLIALHPEQANQHAETVESLLLAATSRHSCPLVVIGRLRQRLALVLRQALPPLVRRGPAYG